MGSLEIIKHFTNEFENKERNTQAKENPRVSEERGGGRVGDNEPSGIGIVKSYLKFYYELLLADWISYFNASCHPTPKTSS